MKLFRSGKCCLQILFIVTFRASSQRHFRIFFFINGYDKYEYHEITAGYCLTGMPAIGIILVTISYQAVQAAVANPVKSPKAE